MFDEPPSMQMRAAIASLLGSCFAIVLILTTHSAQAQAQMQAHETPASASTSTAAPAGAIMRLGGAAMSTLRGPDPALAQASRGLRIHDSGTEPSAGMRWQLIPKRAVRAEPEYLRGSDQFNLGVQVRF